MSAPAHRDLESLADLLVSQIASRAICLEHLRALHDGEDQRRDGSSREINAPRIAAVRALGAARRAEGRDTASMKGVLRALDEQGMGRADVYSSRLFEALFGGRGRNSYFDTNRSISHSISQRVVEDDRWHDVVIALECGDRDALERAAGPLTSTSYSFFHGPHAWALQRRVAGLDGKPLPTQVRWILRDFPTRSTEARVAARGFAAELGVPVPMDNTVRDYSVAAVVALVVGLPDRFPEWDELFAQTMLELRAAHVGTTISECLAQIPWDVIADERKGDVITLRRLFRGYEVKWTAKLDRFVPKSGALLNDLRGRLSCKRRARPFASGSRWTELLDDAERDRYVGQAAELSDVLALQELAEAGGKLTRKRGHRVKGNANLLRAMGPHLSADDLSNVLDGCDIGARSVLALLPYVTPTEPQLVRFAEKGLTEVFDRLHGTLSEETRARCLGAAQSERHEGTAAVLRDGPPPPLTIPRIDMPLLDRRPTVAKVRKPKVPVFQLPVDDVSPGMVVVQDDFFRVGAGGGDLIFRWDGSAWAPQPRGDASSRLVCGDGFVMGFQGSWKIGFDGGELAPLVGEGADHRIWNESRPAFTLCAGGRLVVATNFSQDTLVFPVVDGRIGKPATLATKKTISAVTDGRTLLVRGPEKVEVYELDGSKTWVRTHVEESRSDGMAVSGDRIALGDASMETKYGRTGRVLLLRRDGAGWSREREIIPPKPKVMFFGTMVALAGDALVVTGGAGCRWLLPNVSDDACIPLRAAGASHWGLHAKWLVDAHRGKKRGAPLGLSVYQL